MASSFTPNKHIEKPANGDDVDTWDVPVNADMDRIDLAFGGATSLNVVGASGTVTLTSAQYSAPFIGISGLLTANVNYQIPSGVGGFWWLLNSTTGAFTVSFSSAAGGTPIVLPVGTRVNLLSGGAAVVVGSAAAGANFDITSINGLGLTGLLKGQGANLPLIAATPATDYVAPATPTTFSAKQTFAGSSSTLAMVVTNIAETVVVAGGGAIAPPATVNYDVTTQSVLVYNTAAANNWTLNIRGNGSASLDSILASSQSITISLIAREGATPFYNSVVQVDGTPVTPVWIGGAPIAGNANGFDAYTYSIIKFGPASYLVMATLVQFKV